MGGNANLIEDAMQLLDDIVDLSGQVARVDSHGCKGTLSGSEVVLAIKECESDQRQGVDSATATLMGSKQRTQRVGNPTLGTKQRNEGGLRVVVSCETWRTGEERRYVYEGAQKQG